MKRPLVLQIFPRRASVRQGMCEFLLSYHLQVDRVLNKGPLVYQLGRGAIFPPPPPPRKAIMYDYNNNCKEKQVKQTIPTWSQFVLCNQKPGGGGRVIKPIP